MEVVWNETKNKKNVAKHGISFEEAATVFLSYARQTFEDKRHNEVRFVTIGHSKFGRLLVVVYTYGEEDIKLVSARMAEPRERRKYEEET